MNNIDDTNDADLFEQMKGNSNKTENTYKIETIYQLVHNIPILQFLYCLPHSYLLFF